MVGKVLQLDGADRAFDAYINDPCHIAARLQRFAQMLFDRRNLIQPRFSFEQVQRGVRCGACKRVGHVSGAVHQGRFQVFGEEGVEYGVRRDGCGERHGAAGKGL